MREALYGALLFSSVFSSGVYAQSCTATNEVGDTCSITCPVGQAALCFNAAGGGAPTCLCAGNPTNSQIKLAPLKSTQVQSVSTRANVAEIVSKFLSAYGPVPVTSNRNEWRETEEPVCQPVRGPDGGADCRKRKYPVIVPYTEQRLLTVSPIEIVSSSEAKSGSISFKDFPDELSASFYEAKNCALPSNPPTAPPTVSATLSVTVLRSIAVTISRSITNTLGTSAGFSVGVSGGSFNGQINISQSETTGQAVATSDSQSITQTNTASLSIPFGQKQVVGLTSFKIGVTVPITFTAVIDANLSKNDRGLTRLSEIMPLDARTFVISAILETNNASRAQVVYFPPKPVSAEDCSEPGIRGVVVSPVKMDSLLGSR